MLRERRHRVVRRRSARPVLASPLVAVARDVILDRRKPRRALPRAHLARPRAVHLDDVHRPSLDRELPSQLLQVRLQRRAVRTPRRRERDDDGVARVLLQHALGERVDGVDDVDVDRGARARRRARRTARRTAPRRAASCDATVTRARRRATSRARVRSGARDDARRWTTPRRVDGAARAALGDDGAASDDDARALGRRGRARRRRRATLRAARERDRNARGRARGRRGTARDARRRRRADTRGRSRRCSRAARAADARDGRRGRTALHEAAQTRRRGVRAGDTGRAAE